MSYPYSHYVPTSADSLITSNNSYVQLTADIQTSLYSSVVYALLPYAYAKCISILVLLNLSYCM